MDVPTIAQLFDLRGKGAIVTGGGMGIGQAISFRLAEAGATVVIADIDVKSAGQTAEEIRTRGGKALAIQADARSTADAKKVAQAAVDAFGSLDILVNNAGIFPLLPPMQVTEELWDRVLGVNLKGQFFYSQAVAEHMIRAGRGGKIINIASIDGLHPNGESSHYNASKGGSIMLTKGLALDFAPYKILVNAVAPGSIRTPGTAATGASFAARGVDPAEAAKKMKGRFPLGHSGKPDDIAKVVLFLASAASDYMTGSLVVVDGGFLLS